MYVSKQTKPKYNVNNYHPFEWLINRVIIITNSLKNGSLSWYFIQIASRRIFFLWSSRCFAFPFYIFAIVSFTSVLVAFIEIIVSKNKTRTGFLWFFINYVTFISLQKNSFVSFVGIIYWSINYCYIFKIFNDLTLIIRSS